MSGPQSDTPGEVLIPARPAAWARRGFARYLRGLMARSFCGVRLAHGSREALSLLRAQGGHDGPMIVLLNHHAWWDPLIGLYLADTFAPGRAGYAPMEARQLRTFGFFRRLGVFGVEPDDPASLEAMVGYVGGLWRQERTGVLWLTPQGQFVDVREPIRLRPGAAAVAARAVPAGARVRVISVSSELVFWTDQRPELLLRAAEVEAPASREGEGATVSAWHRAMTRAMQANAGELATIARRREPGDFELIGGRAWKQRGAGAGINPVYDWWLRLRGRSGTIEPIRRG